MSQRAIYIGQTTKIKNKHSKLAFLSYGMTGDFVVYVGSTYPRGEFIPDDTRLHSWVMPAKYLFFPLS